MPAGRGFSGGFLGVPYSNLSTSDVDRLTLKLFNKKDSRRMVVVV